MSDSRTYMALHRGPHGYALPVHVIREIDWLPLLNPAEELPPPAIGTFDWAGTVVPVVDLDCLQGRPARPCRSSDCVVIAEHDGHTIGIVVDEVRDVIEADRLPAAWDFSDTEEKDSVPRQIAGEIERDGRLLAVLDMEGIRAQVHSPEQACPAPDLEQLLPDDESERTVMQERARALLRRQTKESAVGGRPHAVARLAGEALAVPLTEVLEFAEPDTIYPIPRAPAHILGNANLRGEIVTVVDIRRLLQLPDDEPPGPQAMVCERPDGHAAIALDEVSTVIHIDTEAIRPLPWSEERSHGNDTLVRGEYEHDDEILTVIDLPALLQCQALEVDQG